MLNQDEKRTFRLEKEQELRFEVSNENKVYLTLQSGTAEVFGIELPKKKPVELCDTKLAVFTWQGCELQLQGITDLEYVANETPMHLYLKAHYLLDSMRRKARQQGTKGPKVVIVGPQDSGKSSLCQILSCYAMKGGKKILYASIDFQQGSFSIPGAIGASSVEHATIEDGMIFENNLVYFYGHTVASENPRLLEKLVSNLSNLLDAKLEDSEMDLGHMGFIADSFGSLDGSNYDVLKQVLKEIKANVIIVLGSERLYADIQRDLCSEQRQIIQLPKSGGVVGRDQYLRRRLQEMQLRCYFYGSDGNLNPFTTVVTFDQVHIVRVGIGLHVPATALPLGAQSTLDPLQISQVTPSTELLHCMLGVSQAEEEEQIVDSPVYGFVHVAKVDISKRTISLLAPSPGKLPGSFLVMGSIRWLE
ncbi:pre-mRNA cleavage complex II protein Clp1-like protein [Galdieria sulphuraria]|uniref:Protein CLP1 homolog n=1 Tax=Galdieria sulphuraria TaxID=130081 RepID=M2X9Y8_GALSU|nr:pre-mRNA cleavage complex II protein Clp1-like protein [Galdieria sulphuraria]EME26692.1 pre-mRNA cleavage complex II protein Clp1-like protein [Galdieria sulphuraria]|eukprot:XP_005703212.1 pre-mRNA cleavage complex II protein Clp1-like protein [Galdieria sulphuraria]